MAKTIYQVIGKQGKEYQRSTAREYTHGVLVSYNTGEEKLVAACGRKDLAEKKLRSEFSSEWYTANATVTVVELEKIK